MDEQPEPGPPAYYTWRGVRWYRTRKGYYQDRTGQLLHRFVAGVSDPSVDVHHLDEDPGNNVQSNLEPLTRLEHLGRHERTGWAAWDAERRRAVSRSAWERREPRPVECHQCGATFLSTGMRAKFCSSACRTADGRARRRAALLPADDGL